VLWFIRLSCVRDALPPPEALVSRERVRTTPARLRKIQMSARTAREEQASAQDWASVEELPRASTYRRRSRRPSRSRSGGTGRRVRQRRKSGPSRRRKTITHQVVEQNEAPCGILFANVTPLACHAIERDAIALDRERADARRQGADDPEEGDQNNGDPAARRPHRHEDKEGVQGKRQSRQPGREVGELTQRVRWGGQRSTERPAPSEPTQKQRTWISTAWA
jgi:hypothetical protein